MCAHEEQRATKRIEEEDDPIGFVAMLFLPSFSSICIPTDRQTDIEHALLTKDEKVEMTFLFGFLLYISIGVHFFACFLFSFENTCQNIFNQTCHHNIRYFLFHCFPIEWCWFCCDNIRVCIKSDVSECLMRLMLLTVLIDSPCEAF